MTTATVETLTAEVRVLMVGNRQVTLSVYRQLDEVLLADIAPFGRVNDGKDIGTWVVGRKLTTGELVRANVNKYRVPKPCVYKGLLSAPIIVCKAHFRRADETVAHDEVSLTYRGAGLIVNRDAAEDCGIKEHSRGPEHCDGWQPNGQQGVLDELVRKYGVEVERHRAAESLPLIVLAGLR